METCFVPLLGYFDPGAGSLVLQALIGGTAGLLVFAKYLWAAVPSLFQSRKPPDSSVEC